MVSVPHTESRDTRVYILELSIPLFAARGYDGVSMRNISTAVGIKTASIYHHFPDKHALYLAAMEHVFIHKAEGFTQSLVGTGTPQERLKHFVFHFTEFIAHHPDFRRLLQRELLDGDESRLKFLTEHVFKAPFRAITTLSQELAPDFDPNLFAVSLAGLVLFHFETSPIRKFLSGGKPEHEDVNVVTQHVMHMMGLALENK